MNPHRWIITALASGVLFGVIAGIGTYKASPAASAWAWGLYVGFLAASFVAVLWYALVAHRMADTAAQESRLNHQIFEASHRPSLEVIFAVGDTRFYQNEGNYTFPFQLYNHGSVPAVLVGWRGIVRRDGAIEVDGPLQDAGRSIFPTRTVNLAFSNVHGPQGPTPNGVEVEIVVTYRSSSVPEVTYTTRMVASGAGNWVPRFPEIA